MRFPDTPRQLSRIAARFMVVFLLVPFAIPLASPMFLHSVAYLPGVSLEQSAILLMYSWGISIMYSPVVAAFASSFFAWMVASIGVLVASRGPGLASVIFSFGALIASSGFQTEYGFAAVPAVVVLLWLAVAAFRLRGFVHQAGVNPEEAEVIRHQRQALQQRDISTQQVIQQR